MDGIPLVQAAVETVFGSMGVHFMTAAVALFAFTSLIGNYFYAEFNARFISDNKVFLFIFRCTCVVMVFVGAINSMDAAWALADITMGCMAIVNIIALFCLNGTVRKALDDYTRQKKAGKDPVFKAEEAGIKNTTPGIWE